MSSLDKLLISGIRSFNPNDKQTVTFFHPLTLIVGHNGAGKTTIIEALKYACTGEQPANTSGGKFICDPKMVGETEVKAQVKLKFTNVSGREVVCTRSLQVSQGSSADKLTSKTLESLLLVKDPSSGRTFALSSTCAEINEELPNHLGVSKPILENVIFCHQEESFWPLSEPRVLKVKFDEIFAATRYTKALENLKSIRKKTMAEMGGLKVQVAHDKENTNRAAKHRKQLARLEEDADARRERIDSLDGPQGEVSIVMQELQTLLKSQQEAQQIRNKIHSYTLEKDMVEKNSAALAANTQFLNDTDEELQRKLDRFEQSVSRQASEKDAVDSQKASLSMQHEAVQRLLSDLFASKGRYEAERQAHLSRVEERTAIAQELISKHNFAEFASADGLPEFKIISFINRLKTEHDRKLTEARAMKAAAKEKEAEIMVSLQKSRSELSALEEKKRMTKSQQNRLVDRISTSRSQEQGMSNVSDQLDTVTDNISRLQSKIDAEKRSLDALVNENGANSMSDELQTLERRAQVMRDEMSVLSSQGESRARLGIKKTDKARKVEAYNQALMLMKAECETVLQKSFRPDSLQGDLEALVLRQERELKRLKDDRTTKVSESAGIDAKLALLMQSLNAKTSELQGKEKEIRDVCGEMGFLTSYKKARADVESTNDTLKSLKHVADIYRKYISKFQKDNCCSLCNRGFSTASEGEEFLKLMQDVIDRTPQHIAQLDRKLEDATARVEKLSRLEGLWNDCERLSAIEIPDIRKSSNSLEREKASQYSVVEELDQDILLFEAQSSQASNLKARFHDASLVKAEILALERDIASLEISLATSGQEVGRTMDAVQLEYDTLQNQCKTLRNKINQANSEFKLKSQEISGFESTLREHQGEKQRIEFQLQEKQRLKRVILDLQAESGRLAHDIQDIESQISQLPHQIDAFEANLRAAQTVAASEEDSISKDVQALANSVSRISSVQVGIQKYIEERKETQLQTCKNQIDDLEVKIKDIAREKDQAASRLDELTTEVSQIQLHQRNIADNLQLRKFSADKLKLENKIASNRRELSKYDLGNINNQLVDLQTRQDELVSERAEAMGSLRQLEESVKELKKMLDSDFQNIEKQYAENKFKYMVDELAMNDLEKYAKALEQAIMLFHKKKMEEINKIIRELWTKTYKGSDIDTIEIRSDPESKANNRSFNYRVVMITNNVEMDMRGRCSAGQKCGILALDEPTTNLDNENISGLAQALADIISSREKQSNFQLIIITHDEAFVQALGRSEHANSYFRVEKAGGFSTIRQYAIINDQEE